MRSALFIIIISFFQVGSLCSQEQSELMFDFYNPSVKLYAIGENHKEQNSELQLNIIKYIQKQTNVDVLILELPVEMCKIVNDYVQTGKRKNEMIELLNLYNEKSRNNIIKNIESIRVYNDLNPTNKISIEGIDFFTFGYIYLHARALTTLFPELKDSNIPLVEEFILNHKKKHYSNKKNNLIMDSLVKDVQNNESLYKNVLGDRLEVYKTQLNQISLNFKYSWSKQDSIRETIMSKNLNSIIDSNKVNVMICGAGHAITKENDTWYNGFALTSMVGQAKTKYSGQVYSIITLYYERKLYRFFPEFNLLSNDLEVYFEDRSKKYEVITGDELDAHPKAKQRCDMIIVQNTRWKAKK